MQAPQALPQSAIWNGRRGACGGCRPAEASGELSDPALLARAREGDAGAFAALYALHAAKVRGLALKIVRDEAAAEDICQEAFLRLWMNSGAYREGRGAVAAWLYRIARNLALDEYRRRRNERARGAAARPDAAPSESVPDREPGPEERALARALREDLATGLRALPRPQAEAVRLAFIVGLTHREVAAALDQPLGTVKHRIARGLRHLRMDPRLALAAWES